MANEMDDRQTTLVLALSGMITGALTEAFGEVAKELRRYAGSDFNVRLDALEAHVIKSIENAPLDGVSEQDQLFLIEQTRHFLTAIFADARLPSVPF